MVLTSRRSTTAAVALATVLGFGLAGCGGDTTVVTDDGTITVDQEGDGSVKVESSDGSMTITGDQDGEGSVKIEASDGSMTITGDQDGELPEGWPSDVVLPDGGTITSSAAMTTGDGAGWTVSALYADASPKDVIAQMRSALESAGYTQNGQVAAADGAMSAYSGNGHIVTVVVGSEDEGTTMLVTIAEDDG